MTTSITVTEAVWQALDDKKRDRNDTFDDVLRREFDLPKREGAITNE